MKGFYLAENLVHFLFWGHFYTLVCFNHDIFSQVCYLQQYIRNLIHLVQKRVYILAPKLFKHSKYGYKI